MNDYPDMYMMVQFRTTLDKNGERVLQYGQLIDRSSYGIPHWNIIWHYVKHL